MKFLPFENITFKTKVDSEEILNRIRENIEPPKLIRMDVFWGNSNHKPYEGSVNGASFNLTRIIEYRNSFTPRIIGTVEKDFNGTKINVEMRLSTLVLTFIFVWCSGAGFAFFAFLNSSIQSGRFDPTMLIPLGMIVFLYVLATGAFKYESVKSKNYLTQLFEAEIE